MNASKHIHRGVFAGIVWVHLSLTAQHLPNLNLLDYHHCQNTNRWKITWKNAVHPSSTVPEACSKVHRICSGGSQWLDYDARLFQSFFCFRLPSLYLLDFIMLLRNSCQVFATVTSQLKNLVCSSTSQSPTCFHSKRTTYRFIQITDVKAIVVSNPQGILFFLL